MYLGFSAVPQTMNTLCDLSSGTQPLWPAIPFKDMSLTPNLLPHWFSGRPSLSTHLVLIHRRALVLPHPQCPAAAPDQVHQTKSLLPATDLHRHLLTMAAAACLRHHQRCVVTARPAHACVASCRTNSGDPGAVVPPAGPAGTSPRLRRPPARRLPGFLLVPLRRRAQVSPRPCPPPGAWAAVVVPPGEAKCLLSGRCKELVLFLLMSMSLEIELKDKEFCEQILEPVDLDHLHTCSVTAGKALGFLSWPTSCAFMGCGEQHPSPVTHWLFYDFIYVWSYSRSDGMEMQSICVFMEETQWHDFTYPCCNYVSSNVSVSRTFTSHQVTIHTKTL